jgi:hypothetical protein
VVAIELNERNRLNQYTSASEIAEICLEEDIEIPGLGAENQTVEQGPQQIGCCRSKRKYWGYIAG